MAKTNAPNPNSYLAFAREMEGYVAWIGLALPFFTPPKIADVLAPHFSTSEMQDYRYRRDLVRPDEIADAKLRMLDDGVPAAWVNAPEMARFLERQVAVKHAGLYVRHTMRMPKAFAQHGFSFANRSATMEVIVGEHFAFGSGNRATTARRLNRGIERMRGVDGTTASEVRNALLGRVRHSPTNVERLIHDCELLVFAAFRRNWIWDCLADDFRIAGSRRAEVLPRAIEDGRLLHLYQRSVDEVECPEHLTPANRRELHALVIRVCHSELVRKGGRDLISSEELARFRRPFRA